MTDVVFHLSALADEAIFSTPQQRHFTRWDTCCPTSTVTIVSARGDIDGTNASTLAEYALTNTVRCRVLILDLSYLDFFGTDGFSALLRVSVRCARAGTSWKLVPGAAVSRLLRICDPDGSLPTVDSVDAALASLQDQPTSPSGTNDPENQAEFG